MGRYNEIARALDGGRPDDLDPIYWEQEGSGGVIAADWAEGFLDAIRLRADAWLPLLRSPQAAILVAPILALCGDEDGDDLLSLDPATRVEVLDAALGLIRGRGARIGSNVFIGLSRTENAFGVQISADCAGTSVICELLSTRPPPRW